MYLLKVSDFAALETRAGRQKIWKELSDVCQLKNLCLTDDGDFRARTNKSKHRLPNLF
jgi:hypothetical protein